jgi:DNA replication protein
VTERFAGFPAIARATPIPNIFFTAVLPKLRSPAALLAFLWVARFAQERRGAPALVPFRVLASDSAVRASFARLAGSAELLAEGLNECLEMGILVSAELETDAGRELCYGVNTPQSRRALARAGVALAASPGSAPARPDIFRLYEEHIGTITPIVGERLLEAAERYPQAWIEDAFREAALRNVRNWRYIERILERWAEEGRAHEAAAGDSFEARRRRYLGGAAPRGLG